MVASQLFLSGGREDMRKEVVSPLVHLLCTGGGERGREEDTCERTCGGHECMGQTHTIQVPNYIYVMWHFSNAQLIRLTLLAFTFGKFLKARKTRLIVSPASSKTRHLNCHYHLQCNGTSNGRSADLRMYIIFASNE